MEDGEIYRICRLSLLWKIFPFGTHAGGPGRRALVLLIVLHALGRPFWFVAARYEDRLTALYKRLRGQ